MIKEYDKNKYVNPFDPEKDLRSYRDYKNVVDTAYQDGYVQGVKQRLAKMLKEEGMATKIIEKVIGLESEEIENL